MTSRFTMYDIVGKLMPGLFLIFTINKVELIAIGDLKESSIGDIAIITIIGYTVGLILDMATMKIYSCLKQRNNYKAIKKAFCKLTQCKTETEINDMNESSKDEILNKYYEAYYKAVDRYKYSSIPVLEAQLSFARNIIVSIFIILICFLLNTFFPENCRSFVCNNNFIALVLLILALISLIIFINKTQYKIYERAWEDEHYTR